MKLSDEKIKKLEQLDSDYSRLIIKMDKYLNAEHFLNPDIVLLDTNDKDSISNILKDVSKSLVISLNIDFNQVLSEISDNYNEKVAVIIDIDSVSLYPIWNTRMRRKLECIIKSVNNLNDSQITDKKLYNILLKTKLDKADEDNLLKIEDVLNALKEVFNKVSNKDNVQVLYTADKNNINNGKKYLINELSKVVHGLRLNDGLYEYIYDTLCKDIDSMFSIYRFCDFRNDKCLSQRHKNLFTNNYPVPDKDGCCFNVYRKCEYLKEHGGCEVRCLACKLYTCPYITKLGVGLYTSEILLMKAFFNNTQRRDSVFEFFQPEEKVLKKIKKHV